MNVNKKIVYQKYILFIIVLLVIFSACTNLTAQQSGEPSIKMKSYNDPNNGVTINYPDGWEVKITTLDSGQTPLIISSPDYEAVLSLQSIPGSDDQFAFDGKSNEEVMSMASAIWDVVNSSMIKVDNFEGEPNITVDTFSGMKFLVFKIKGKTKEYSLQYIINAYNGITRYVAIINKPTASPSSIDAFDKILASIQFNNTVMQSDLKTYRHVRSGIEFRYPGEWFVVDESTDMQSSLRVNPSSGKTLLNFDSMECIASTTMFDQMSDDEIRAVAEEQWNISSNDWTGRDITVGDPTYEFITISGKKFISFRTTIHDESGSYEVGFILGMYAGKRYTFYNTIKTDAPTSEHDMANDVISSISLINP